MKLFWSFFKTESKRMITAMNIILLLMFFLVAMYFVNDGIAAHKRCLKEVDEVKKIEKQKVTLYQNYASYGLVGIRLILQPSPVSIFFSDSRLTSEMYASLNVGERLSLEHSFKGKNLSENILLGYADFSRFFLIICSLLCLIYGYKTFEHREYIKMLSTFNGERRIYFPIVSSRFALIILFSLFMIISGILLAYVRGIAFVWSEWIMIFKFTAALLIVSFFFFITGVLIGTLTPGKYKIVIVMMTWAIFIFLIPIAVSKIAYKNAQSMPSNTRLELENWNSNQKFEQRAVKEQGEYKKETALSEPVLRLIGTFLTNEYKEIQNAEKKIENGMIKNTRLFHWLSTLTPGTFYLSVTTEMSSQGNNSIVDFFKYSEDMKDKFVRFWFKKKYSPGNDKVESFITGDENVFKSVSRVPGTYWPGMGIMFLYALGFTLLSYRRYDKFLYYVRDKSPGLDDEPDKEENPDNIQKEKLSLRLEPGKYYILKKDENRSGDYLYSMFSGKTLPKAMDMTDITFRPDRLDMEAKQVKKSFMYLCSPEDLPDDIRVGDFLKMVFSLLEVPADRAAKINFDSIKPMMRIDRLTKPQKFDLVLMLPGLVKRDVYLFDDPGKKLNLNSYLHLKAKLEELSTRDAVVIFFTDNNEISDIKSKQECGFFDITDCWKTQIAGIEEMQ